MYTADKLKAMTFGQLIAELAVQAASCPQHGTSSGIEFVYDLGFYRNQLIEEIDRRVAGLLSIPR